MTKTTWQDFVRDNMGHIELCVRKFAPRNAKDDFLQDLVVLISRKHRSYDPHRSSPKTWIWWQARALRTSFMRSSVTDSKHVRFERLPYSLSVPPNQETSFELFLVWKRADSKAREAMVVMAEGLTYAEVRARFGITHQAMQCRLARHRKLLETNNGDPNHRNPGDEVPRNARASRNRA